LREYSYSDTGAYRTPMLFSPEMGNYECVEGVA